MGKKKADKGLTATIRLSAGNPNAVQITETAKYDLLAHNLTKADICDAICDWIDAGKPVDTVTMKGRDAGSTGYVMKPTISGKGYYVKVLLRDIGGGRILLIISTHPDH